ncbi:hypothetical protein ANANG_G00258630 [Anguilla anguilla]|uniref:Aquaporin 7 n=1 Tax=Anguilla anguilla TaxID=7936 RepID=A0A9D3LPU8_ANGAN|nr:hypothetical protein ANANG_G00258630 [Anguilla anguilla]
MKDTLNSGKDGQAGGGRMPFAFRIRNECFRSALAETLSTYVMMTFGLGTVAQVVTGDGLFGRYLSINLGFGLGVAMGVHIAGKVSGAHMNAAVSFTMCLFGRLAWRMFPVYVAAQMLGSFMAAGTVFSLYYDAMLNYCGATSPSLAPGPPLGSSPPTPPPTCPYLGASWTRCWGTAMLLLCLMALSDQRNQPAQAGSEPLAVGLLVLLLGVSMGSNSGYAINPSRDLPPRIFTALAGWGPEVFRAGQNWWWVPLLAPLIGSLCVMGAGGGDLAPLIAVRGAASPRPSPDLWGPAQGGGA